MADPKLIALADHPRAAPAIRRAKARGGLAAFVVVVAASVLHGTPMTIALEHAVVGGLVGYLLTWAAAVAVWRRLLTAQALSIARAGRRRREEAWAAARAAARPSADA